MRLIIVGPQASGKGTQAEMLQKTFGTAHISVGERLREEISQGTTIGKRIEPILARGDLIPDELTNRIIARYLREHPSFVLDGFPRTPAQAAFLDTVTTIDKVILLKVKDATSIKRIQGRRECAKGHDYHLLYKPPKRAGICDVDGLPLKRREDDTEAAIKHRLELYHQQTEPIIAHYGQKVIVIDGERSIADVHQEIVTRLGNASRPSRTTQAEAGTTQSGASRARPSRRA